MKLIFEFKLPDYFSLLNGISGFIALISLFFDNMTLSLVMVLVAAVFDFLDGKIARKFGTDSALGKELDSLCDVISFGLVPAAQIAFTMISSTWGIFFAIFWLICGIMRLARFNVLNIKTHFLGTPITLAAIIVTILHLFTYNINILGASYFLFSVLMISDLKIEKI